MLEQFIDASADLHNASARSYCYQQAFPDEYPVDAVMEKSPGKKKGSAAIVTESSFDG